MGPWPGGVGLGERRRKDRGSYREPCASQPVKPIRESQSKGGAEEGARTQAKETKAGPKNNSAVQWALIRLKGSSCGVIM